MYIMAATGITASSKLLTNHRLSRPNLLFRQPFVKECKNVKVQKFEG